MPTVSIDPPTTKPAKGKRIDYALGATLVAAGFSFDQAAKRAGAATGTSLRVGLSRKGITASVARQQVMRSERAADCALEALSARTRNTLAHTVERHSEALSRVPARANIKSITQAGAALEPLVRSADKVFGWSTQEDPGIVAIGIVESAIVQVMESEGLAPAPGAPESQPIDCIECAPAPASPDLSTVLPALVSTSPGTPPATATQEVP